MWIENSPLLVERDTFVVLDEALQVHDCRGARDLEAEGLACHRRDRDVDGTSSYGPGQHMA